MDNNRKAVIIMGVIAWSAVALIFGLLFVFVFSKC